jgi:hypothetical protein
MNQEIEIKQPVTTFSIIKFLGMYINDSMNWSCHVECIMPKLSSACYIMRSIVSYVSFNTFKTIYYSYFNSIISYSLIFCGNSSHSLKIFRIKKNHDGLQEWGFMQEFV